MSATPEVTDAESGLPLSHWLALVGIAFVLAIAVVWLQVSSVRLGYLLVEEERRVEMLAADVAHAKAEIERRSSPLALAELAHQAKLELESGRAKRPEKR